MSAIREQMQQSKKELTTQWIGAMQYCEFHDRERKSTKNLNNGLSGYHLEMLGWWENQLRKLRHELNAFVNTEVHGPHKEDCPVIIVQAS